jgi:site-specific DNA recombinase
MEVALYVRVSTTRQQHTQTIEQQLARLREYVATQPDWHLAEEHIYRDDGYSGGKLNRPGLDRLRDRAALAGLERVLMTAPDRLARNDVHQMLLIDELAQRGCQVEFVERPMRQDPHDQLLLQIRGAVAEYERTLITDRMRRGRQAKLRSGQMLPWSVPPYGYVMDPERPRDPQRLHLDPVKAAVITQIFAWYTDPRTPATLYSVAKRLTDDHIPTPRGGPRWNVASVRGILRSPVYAGTAYSERTRPVPARLRQSALRPVGPGHSHRPAPPEEWMAIPVPAIISEETFAAAQAHLSRNTHMARRHNTTHEYLLRGLVSCGQCQLACTGRTLPPGYHYYLCRGRTDALRAAQGERCTARFTPARALDELVWQDLCRILREPALITHALARAHGGAWLPQALQARRKTLRDALIQLERQQARLLEVYLAEIIGRDEFERKRQEVTQTQHGLTQQLRQLEAQAQQQVDIAALAQGLEAFCQWLQPTLNQLTFAQRRQLVELLIDHVIVTHDQVEIRYVVPTGPKGETTPFCHVRLDYLRRPAVQVQADDLRSTPVHPVRDQHHRASCQRLVLKAHHDPDLAQTGDAYPQREAPVGVLTYVDGAIGLRRDQWYQILNRDVGARQLQRPAVGIAQVKAGRFQPAVFFEQTDPVLAPPGQDPDQVLGQVPGVEHHHAKRHFAPDGFFHQVNGQDNFGPKLLMPRPKLGILEQHGVDLLMQAIPPLGVCRDLQIGKMLRHTRGPLGQFLVAAIEAQAQREAHRTTDRQAGDRVMGQGIGTIAMVVVTVHVIKEAPDVFAQGIINDHQRLASSTTMGRGVLEHEADAAAIDRVLPPGSLREKAREVRFVGAVEDAASDIGHALMG